MDAEGGNLQQIMSDSQLTTVDIRPDAEYIVYTQGNAVYMKRIVDSGGKYITDALNLGTGGRPDWASDNWHLAVESPQGIATMGWRLNSSILVEGGDATWPDWSPDMSKIAFVRGNDIYIQDGTVAHQLTTSLANDWQPNWSPDGNKIVFTSDRDGNREIYVMNIDGTEQINLTNSPGNENLPVWSP